MNDVDDEYIGNACDEEKLEDEEDPDNTDVEEAVNNKTQANKSTTGGNVAYKEENYEAISSNLADVDDLFDEGQHDDEDEYKDEEYGDEFNENPNETSAEQRRSKNEARAPKHIPYTVARYSIYQNLM